MDILTRRRFLVASGVAGAVALAAGATAHRLEDLFAKLADCGMGSAEADRFLASPGATGFSGQMILPPAIWSAVR